MGLRQPGDVLGERYRLVRPLASGGMGSVWRAEHLSLKSSVALKLIDAAPNGDAAATGRFLREARLAAALRSPHVVQIFDYGVDGETPYIVMELLEGELLGERLERVGRLSAAQTARMVQHLARAMTRAHELGIVHRDLKPENIFIVKNDDEEIFKVFDFGIAKTHLEGFGSTLVMATRTGSLLGTPSYMSPEQAQGAKVIDHRSDIWALGVIAFRCLLGCLPFTGDNVGQLVLGICAEPLPVPSRHGKVPDGFDAWFARACARKPLDRFDSAKDAASALSALAIGSAAAPSAPTRPPLEPTQLTTGQFANSEVLSRPHTAWSRKRVATPVLIAGGLALATLAVSKLSADRRQGAQADSPPAAQMEQAAPALQASPEPMPEPPPASPAASPPAASTFGSPVATSAASGPSVGSAEMALPPSNTEGVPGVRLIKGVQVVPMLPRAPKAPAAAVEALPDSATPSEPLVKPAPPGTRPGRGAATAAPTRSAAPK